MEMTPKEHIEDIRRTKFSIGGELNRLTKDLHQAVKYLSAELYAKDVHFLMELIQNAEDNQYCEEVSPKLEFIITSKDITATGAPATLLIFNNEKGFSPSNIESICSVGRSTKGNRSCGYIGEKGIGFKSVFLVTAQPYIFSNGYQIRFNEKPCPHCGLGYIVPEWVEENPTHLEIEDIYHNTLPTTTFVLPLKPDKVNSVKQQLSSLHPEVLLFLTKIKNLSVREENEDPRLNTVSAIAISTERYFMTRKNMNAESYTLDLTAKENGDSQKECSYYMWKQRFPVRVENVVERRADVEEWVVTLAFPNQERLGMSLPGVYAFLPTEMVTNFPFIIQADFVLASSRETILLDDKWNQGILECVPSAFMDAFRTLVIGSDHAPVSSLPRMFKFLPIDVSPYENLNAVREKIKDELVEEMIIPTETYTEQKRFCKPCDVGRLLPDFWDILAKARDQGVYLLNLSFHGINILNSSFDRSEYDSILNFLGVEPVKAAWYARCIKSSNLVEEVSEDVYLELLLFVANNWGSRFCGSNMMSIPLIKYVGSDGNVSLFSLNECTQHYGAKQVLLADPKQSCPPSWMIDWNKEFTCPDDRFFMPEKTQQALWRFPRKQTLLEWLADVVNVTTMNVSTFGSKVCSSIKNNRKLAIACVHFLYHSSKMCYLSSQEVCDLCSSMPLVDRDGCVVKCRKGVLVPANASKWSGLIGSNPWRNEDYVELNEDYLLPCQYAGQFTLKGELINFLKIHADASDIPHISPPNADFSSVYTPLTKENAFLLLDWIRNLRYKGVRLPERFLKGIKEGKWLKVTVNGRRAPSQSFLIGSSLGKILQGGSDLVDIPLIDQSFYGNRINDYEDELKTAGVMFSYGEACEFIGRELMSRAASFTLSRNQVLLMLKFIQYLRKSFLPLDEFVESVREGSWLKTSRGNRSPEGSVFYDSEWQMASQISDIPFIDHTYYGVELNYFKEELELLGVIVGFPGSYQLVINHLKEPSILKSLTAEAALFILECLKFSLDSSKLINALKATKCLKTNMGFKTPGDCFLHDPEWGCILEVFNDLPVVDHKFYGEKIFTYKAELRQTGVVVDFEEAIQKFALIFKQKASESAFNSQNVLSFLSCCKLLKGTQYNFPAHFSIIMRDQKWLHTRVGDYRLPGHCILYGPEWKSISPITNLPFIDDSHKCYGKRIHEYKEELESIGVVTELKNGVNFVPKCLIFPSNPSTITPENVFSLLECIRLLIQENCQAFDDDFRKRLSKNWLKTHAGYRPPDECLLYDSKWRSYLKPTDGPFIDENFYGPELASYRKELSAVGVTIDVEKGCSLVVSHLHFHSEYNTIVQIYRYLNVYNWIPEDEAAKMIWVPDGDKDGDWVNPEECVIHDKDNLFGPKFYALENFYEKKIIPFFSCAMEVRTNPSVDDYVDLWNDWECSVEQLSHDKCCKFWIFIAQHWNLKTEKKLFDSLVKLPAISGDNEILLVDKDDVFIADNLHLKKLFEQESVFVWYPQHNMASLPMCKLFDIYRNLGARNISESVCKEESSVQGSVDLRQVHPSDIFDIKMLVKLVLGFLACSSLKMEPGKRHEAVQGLINLKFLEIIEPVTVSYSLSLSSGAFITRKANRMVRWERESSTFFTQKQSVPSLMKYATYFSEAISEGVLRENHDHVPALSELIALAFVLKFDNEEVEFLMESKNLQIFCEDEDFLSSFPSD